MTLEALLILLLCASVAAGAALVRRPDASPVTCWVAGWVAAGAGAVLLVVRQAFPHAALLAYPLGTLFPVLLLMGALHLAARPVPRWLLPAALGYGLLRAAVAAGGHAPLAWDLSLLVEPAAVLAAARIVHRATPRSGASLSQRLLAPSLVVLAGVGIVHAIAMLGAEQPPAAVLAMWAVAVPSLFGIQMHAEWERMRRNLELAREQLEARVDARTQELARVNASLRESEARHRIAAELGSDLSFGFRVDANERLYDGWISDAFPRLTGFSMADLARIGWVGVVHREDRASARAQFAEIGAGHARDLEFRIVAKDGRVLTVRGRLRVTHEGDCLRVVGAARDVTETRRAEEERRKLELHVLEAQRLESLALLAGGVAHDFNNLLVVILGNSRVALAETPPEAPISARLLRIRAAAEQGARLTEQMLAYSGKSSVALKPLDLSQLVEEMADLLRASVSERCRLLIEAAPRAPVEGDATQLQQVVLNLVTNASESLGGRAGTVRVRTGRSTLDAEELAGAAGGDAAPAGPYALLEVCDDGEGMDAATQARVFEPFFTTKFSGRGLGLAAVLGLVRAHRGVVQVQSHRGAGTTLRVWIPEAREAVARAGDAAVEPAAIRQRATVLVVDDQDSVLEVAQLELEAAGHRVLTALGGRAGIECFRARAHEIQVVLLDLGMPDADGEEVLRELQQLCPDVRVIIATGYAAHHASERLRARGVVGFVRKPYEPEELHEQVARALAASD